MGENEESTEISVKKQSKVSKTGKKRTAKQIAVQFKPGESGNPLGKPPGTLSIKSRVRAALEKDPDAMTNFVKHFTHKNRELAWQMLEGKPKQENEVTVDKEGIQALTDFFRSAAVPIKPK